MKASKEYTFDFINGWKPTGKPVLIRRKVRADSIAEAEARLQRKYPNAGFVSLGGRIRQLSS